MTDKPTPTDAELEALLLNKLPASKHYIRPVIEKMVAAMQAAIDKWGTPATVGVGEVAEHYRNAIASACEGWTMTDGLRKHLETALWSQPSPTAPATQQAGEPVYAFRRRGQDDFCTCTFKRYTELSDFPEKFEMRIFYTAPQPAPAPLSDDIVKDAARYRLLRRGRHWSVIDGIGNDLLRAEALDAAVDAVLAAQGGKV